MAGAGEVLRGTGARVQARGGDDDARVFSHCSVEEFELQVREAIQAHGGGAGTTEGKCGMEAQVVKRMIASALDRGAREREMRAERHGDAAGAAGRSTRMISNAGSIGCWRRLRILN